MVVTALTSTAAADPAVAGSKAARLAQALASGLAVPPGFVVPVGEEVDDAVLVAAAMAVADRLAVRSSAVAEDLAGASFAGMYESYLDVPPDGVPEAVRRCRQSADTARVAAYRPVDAEPGVAVLVQAMVPAEAAGVAFTADPMTGDRDVAVITAVTGLAETLVVGEVTGESWRISGGRATTAGPAEVLTAAQAAAVADTARRLEQLFGCPQDVEWAIAAGTVHVIQARPMTALPDPISWAPPGPGLWACNFRLGEWLPDPVTPLFGDGLLPAFDAGFRDAMHDTAGAIVGFPYALVHGWYYATPNPRIAEIPAAVLHSHGRLLGFMLNTVVLPSQRPARADRALDQLYRDWRDRLLPDYHRLADLQVEDRPVEQLLSLVDHAARTAGYHFWYLTVVGGAAWKIEQALRRFMGRHQLDSSDAAQLLSGLTPVRTTPAAHAVHSLDWFYPTAGESIAASSQAPPADGPASQSQVERLQLQERCADQLRGRPRLLTEWTTLLALAQKYARIREEQANNLTLAWPLLRACARKLGEALVLANTLDDPCLVFFLTRAELDQATPLTGTANRRQQQWQQQRRLTPPLTIGPPPPLIGRHLAGTIGAASPGPTDRQIHGQPASPGRATGPARVVRGPEDFTKVAPGDIIVAAATTPAWTPLFSLIAAVVTDRGTAAAHASLIAREYGIPAVVATGDATNRITDGTHIAVDGTRGIVSIGDNWSPTGVDEK